MFFDDRLGTVLRQRAGGEAIARIQYRQLLDLLGTMPSEANGPQIDAAYDRIAEISSRIPAPIRAAMLQEQGLRLRSARLVALLASGEPPVAAAAVRRAELTGEQWRDLAPALPLHARGVMRARDDLGSELDGLLARLGILDRGLPVSEAAAAAAVGAAADRVVEFRPKPSPEGESRHAPEGIGDIVRRIERFREARRTIEGETATGDSPRLPLGEQATLAPPPLTCFDFATDGEGRIAWAEGSAGPMAHGLRLATEDPLGPLWATPAVAAAFRRRQPIRAGQVEIAGAAAIAGRWQIDATPLFDPAGGRFTGYAGRLRRLPAAEAPAASAPAVRQEGGNTGGADRIRQLLHELRTPVNAIQGFAEVIQQQLFGPTPHEYRALAATIAGDAARMLAGFDELDRLAKLDTGAPVLEAGECDLVPIVFATVARLRDFAAARGGGFALRAEDERLRVALSEGDAERLVWRLLATLAGASAPGETLRLRLRRRENEVRVSIDLPDSLAHGEDDEAIFQPVAATPAALSAGMFGAGFALRLARAEANAANGALERRKGRLRLMLPLLTARAADNSHSLAGGG